MIAVEGGRQSPSGEIFNDFPDRLSDTFVLIGAGYAVAVCESWAPQLGWTAAVLALMTAYVRVLGRSCGASSCFLGPMAKQHRMAILTLASLLACVEILAGRQTWSMFVALLLVVAGSLVTIVRRLKFVIKELEND